MSLEFWTEEYIKFIMLESTFKMVKEKLTFTLSLKEGEYLVKLARNSILEVLNKENIPITKTPEILNTKCGTFVTLKIFEEANYNLRGCIGLPYPVKPLIEAVKESAKNAAFNDPRFHPVQKDEMNRIIVEVSVLTPPVKINVKDPQMIPKMIEVGKDGLIIQKGYRSGLLLPQVAVDYNWNAEEFLIQCCYKAGIAFDSWLFEETGIMKFQALIYAEKNPGGEIRRIKLNEGGG
jgi:uncharacterized protein (TIGR00296 family)